MMMIKDLKSGSSNNNVCGGGLIESCGPARREVSSRDRRHTASEWQHHTLGSELAAKAKKNAQEAVEWADAQEAVASPASLATPSELEQEGEASLSLRNHSVCSFVFSRS